MRNFILVLHYYYSNAYTSLTARKEGIYFRTDIEINQNTILIVQRNQLDLNKENQI